MARRGVEIRSRRTARPDWATRSSARSSLVAQGWLEPANLRIEEARSLVDQLVGPIASKEAKLEDKIDDIEKQLQAVLDKPRAE